jgi:hypothetical protein
MKNIILTSVFVGMLGFYGNAMAFMISGNTEYVSIPRDLIMQIIADGKIATNKIEKKLGKKVGKSQNKIDILSLKGDLTNRQTNKKTKHENRIVALLNGMDVTDSSALITDSIVSEGEFPPAAEKLDENQQGENVPEPSVLALLGLGLAGLGVARRFKRSA